MKIKIVLAVVFLSASCSSFAQKALPIRVDSLLVQIPPVTSCAASFKLCTVVTNSEGLVSVKDEGSLLNELQGQLAKYSTELSAATVSNSYTNTSVPSQDQINQTVQNAMQMQGMSKDQLMQMAQNKQNHSALPSSNNPALMKELGQAQKAVEQLGLMQNELSTKASQLGGEYHNRLQAVPTVLVTCKDYKVQGADLALPNCSCVKGLYIDYYQKRVDIEDEYLKKLDGILGDYIPRFKDQIAIIDKVENDLSYGDAVSIPAFKRQVVGVQQQALGSLLPVLGIVSHAIKESGSEYTGIVNTNNGHLPTPCQ